MLAPILILSAALGQFTVTPGFTVSAAPASAPTPEPPAHAVAPDPVLSADLIVDRWRAALGFDPPARRRAPVVDRPAVRPAANPKPIKANRPAARDVSPARSWRVAPDNPAVELYTDGRTYTAWRYRAGFAPPVMTAAPPVAYQPAYSFMRAAPYCPPGGS